MSWKAASFVALALWGSYGIFAGKANAIHGEKVTMVFEAAAMVLVALFTTVKYGTDDFTKVTTASAMFATIMGLMSAIGIYFQFYALRQAPDKMAVIILITCSFPVITVILGWLLGTRLQPQQWLGVALAAAGLVLVNWTK